MISKDNKQKRTKQVNDLKKLPKGETPTKLLDPFFVSETQAGTRLDILLKSVYPQYSRTYFQYLIENESVLVNGISLKKRQLVKVGDEIEVALILTPEISLEPEDIPLDILYEDSHFLAVNKPPGMVIYPAPGHPNGTFVNALLHHCRTLSSFS